MPHIMKCMYFDTPKHNLHRQTQILISFFRHSSVPLYKLHYLPLCEKENHHPYLYQEPYRSSLEWNSGQDWLNEYKNIRRVTEVLGLVAFIIDEGEE